MIPFKKVLSIKMVKCDKFYWQIIVLTTEHVSAKFEEIQIHWYTLVPLSLASPIINS